jgi:RNA polymerase primary sigma factor
VVGELGATVVEWVDYDESFPFESTMEEDRQLAEAIEFAEDLASGRNDPFRFYSKDIRGDLLNASEEIALGREMEETGRAAIAALAVWPEGLSAVFAAATGLQQERPMSNRSAQVLSLLLRKGRFRFQQA